MSAEYSQAQRDLLKPCLCGCGTMIRARKNGKNQYYVFGHNRRKSPVEFLIEDRGFSSPCWIWQRSTTHGYAGAWDSRIKRNVRASRLYYERARGPIPSGLQLDHLCRVTACVNPDHLEAVTCKENIRRSTVCKLNVGTVALIRELKSAGDSNKSIAERFGIARGYVWELTKGRKWA